MMCPELDNIKIGGYWDSSYVSYFKIELRRCLEGSINPFTKENCKTMEETDKILNDRVYFSMIYQDALIDPDNYYNPLNSDLIYSTILINNGILKREIRNYKEFLVDSDYGWILKTQEIQNLLGIDTITNDFLEIDKFNYNLYLESYFHIGKKVNKYRREYKKIQTLAAEVGGIIKFLVNIASTIIYFYSSVVYKYRLANIIINESEIQNTLKKKQTINNNILSLKYFNNSNFQISQLKSSNFEISNNNSKLLLNSNVSNIDERKNERKEEETKKEKENFFIKKLFLTEGETTSEKIPFFDYLVNFFPFSFLKILLPCCPNKNIQTTGIIKHIKQFLYSQISVESFIKYNFKLEKLSHYILNSNQKKLIDYFEYGSFENFCETSKSDYNFLFNFSKKVKLDSVTIANIYKEEINKTNTITESLLDNFLLQ